MSLPSCVFCRIVSGLEGSYKVYEDRDVVVILDKYPVSKGHLLVVTKEHYESIHDAQPRIAVKALTVASALARIYRVELGASGVNIVVNSGRSAGQEIFHFHIHIIPRWSDTRSLWGSRYMLTREEADEVLRKLAHYTRYIEEYVSEALVS